jgi:hypothetical protein
MRTISRASGSGRATRERELEQESWSKSEERVPSNLPLCCSVDQCALLEQIEWSNDMFRGEWLNKTAGRAALLLWFSPNIAQSQVVQ